MTRPQVQPPDVVEPVVAFLEPLVTAPAGVGKALDPDWKRGDAPWLAVFDDGGATDWPVAVNPRLRVTVWASTRSAARDMAAWALGVLMAHPVPGIAQLRDPSSILAADDSQNGGVMASFTIAARARLTPVSNAPYVP